MQESGVKVELKELQHWYNGYKSGSLEDIYNPWSILNFIYDGGFTRIRAAHEGNLEAGVFVGIVHIINNNNKNV